MGFYGNIVNSNKASFTFDRIYSSRHAMEAALENKEGDGVFLGRYVLIDYDEPPLKGYYNPADKKFYHDVHHRTVMTGKEGQIYQDLHTVTVNNFYLYTDRAWKLNNNGTPYAMSYNTDVNKFGRGYDGTAWVKTYETTTNNYKYVLVAELNSVVPNFHLLVEPPLENANAPYFDRDSTNVDYYLHVTPTLKNEIGIVGASGLSDETIDQYKDTWSYPNNNQHKEEHEATLITKQKGDIYYNAAGFDVTKQTLDTTTQDSINYELTKSGRQYSNGAYDPYGKTDVVDTRTWHIHLPSIGNAICSVWDKMYGTVRNQTYSTSRGDSKALYDQTTFIGAVNRLRDLLGYTFKTRDNIAVGNEITVQDNNLYYDGNPPSTYYYYAYSPKFELDASGDYCKIGDEYKPVNKQAITDSSQYYRLVDRWVLTKLEMPEEDSLYGFIIALHRLVGTGDDDSRNMETIRGCINRIKDIVANIDLQLKSGKLMHTNNSGVIETTDTAYPSADVDKTRVLIGQPTGGHSWENRIRKIGIVAPSTSEDTWTTSTGEIDSNTNNNNTVNFKAGNKWIGLNVDTANQLVEIIHSKSAQQAHEFALDMQPQNLQDETKNECSYTFPLVNTDHAGHVIGSTNTTIYVPYVYKNIALNQQSEEVANSPSENTDTQSAATTNDTFTFATGNKWIRADIKDNGLTYGHLVQTINTSAPTSDLNNSGTFNTEEYTYDEAGHIRSKAVRTLTLPYNYKTIAVTQSAKETAITPNDESIAAKNQADSYTLAAGNKWIQLNAADQTVTIAHSTQGTAGSYTGTDLDFTTFGGTITLYGYETDNAGHIIKNPTYNITLPKGSLNNTAVTSAADTVLTSIGFTDSTGEISTTYDNIGNLKLTSYAYNADDYTAIANTDTINSAFSKVNAQIAKEITDRNNAVSNLNNNITAMNERLVANDASLSDRLTTEASTRESEDTRILGEANSYTDTKIAGLVNSAPETLDTLNELAVALGGDENFATTVATNIGVNTAAINVEKEKIDAHVAAQDNPHKVTASQVGLGNVTNESKATMFTNPAFTGVPTAPTADAGTNSEQLATTAFVAGEVANAKDEFNESLAQEIDARERADQACREEFTNALATETQARLDSLEALLNDLLTNYGITLNTPTFEITQEEIEAEGKVVVTVSASDECTMIWYKKQLDADPIAVSEAVPVGAFDITEDGEYYCVITRTHNTHTSEAQSEIYNIVVPKLPEPEPEEPTPDPENPEEPEA